MIHDDDAPEPKIHGALKAAFDKARKRASVSGGEAQRAAKVVVTLPRAPWEDREDVDRG